MIHYNNRLASNSNVIYIFTVYVRDNLHESDIAILTNRAEGLSDLPVMSVR